VLDVKGRNLCELNELVGKTSKLEFHLDVQAKVIIVQNYHVEIGGGDGEDTSRPICFEFKHLRRSRRLASTKRTYEKMQGTSNRTGGLAKTPKLVVDNLATDALPTNGTPEEPATDGSMSELPGKTPTNTSATGRAPIGFADLFDSTDIRRIFANRILKFSVLNELSLS
jgi:hypothetical protein